MKSRKIQSLEREIESLEREIAAHGDPTKLPTKAIAIAQKKAYNDFMNEGGEGYLPTFRSIEGYGYCVERLAELHNSVQKMKNIAV